MNKFLFFLLLILTSITFANPSSTRVELQTANDAITFASERAYLRYEAENWLCTTSSQAHGVPFPIPVPRSRTVDFNSSKHALETPEGSVGGFCRYKPNNAITYLTGMSSDGSHALVAQVEIYNTENTRVVEIFCKSIVEFEKERLRCRNADEVYPQSATKIFLNLSEGTSTIVLHQE